MCCISYQSCLTLCNPLDCSPQGSSVHGIFQARIVEWVAISFSRESSQPRNQARVTCVSCIASGFFTHWAIREAHSVTGTDLIVRPFTLSKICFPLTFHGSVCCSWAIQRPKCGLSSIGRHTNIWGQLPTLIPSVEAPLTHYLPHGCLEWPLAHQYSYESTVSKNGHNTLGRLLLDVTIQHSTSFSHQSSPQNFFFSYFWDTFKINPFSSHP